MNRRSGTIPLTVREIDAKIDPIDLMSTREFMIGGHDLLLFGENHVPPRFHQKYNHMTWTGRPVQVGTGEYDVDFFIFSTLQTYQRQGTPLTLLLEAPYHYRGSIGSKRNFFYKRSPVLHLDRILEVCYQRETCPYTQIKIKFIDLRSCDTGEEEKALDPLLQLVVVLTERRKGRGTVLKETFPLLDQIRPFLKPYALSLIKGKYNPALPEKIREILFQKVPDELVEKGRHKIARKIGKNPYKRQILEFTTYLIHLVDQKIQSLLADFGSSKRSVKQMKTLLDQLIEQIGELSCLPINGYVLALILETKSDTIVLMGNDHIEKISYFLDQLAEA